MSILWTIDIQIALESYFRGFTVLYLIFTLTLFVIKSPKDLESLIDIYNLSSVLSIIYIVLNVDLAVVAAGARLGVSQDEVEISPNDTAMVCVNGILLSFYCLRRDGYKNFKALYYFISLVLFVMILVVPFEDDGTEMFKQICRLLDNDVLLSELKKGASLRWKEYSLEVAKEKLQVYLT